MVRFSVYYQNKLHNLKMVFSKQSFLSESKWQSYEYKYLLMIKTNIE